MTNENELFDDIVLTEEKKQQEKKEPIINKVYQNHIFNINEYRGETLINLVLDDKNKTVQTYTTTTLNVYDDKNLKHFKNKIEFQRETDEFKRSKFVYPYNEYQTYIQNNKLKPIRFVLPSKNSYNKSLLTSDSDKKSFINNDFNLLHDKLSCNINKIWNDCDVFSQQFKDILQSYFYGKIYQHRNLSDEQIIENSKIVLFTVRGKAFLPAWNDALIKLQETFYNFGANKLDENGKKNYIEYLKSLFNRTDGVSKDKFIKLFFSKVSENKNSKKKLANDNDCTISHINPNINQINLESKIINEDDFYFTRKIKEGDEWVDSKEKMTLDLSNIIILDSIYDEESKKYNIIKFDSTTFDSDWYKMKIAESERLIKEYRYNDSDINITDVI